jgi:hypothetical protein
MFNSKGKLNIPKSAKHVKEKAGAVVVNEAYCPEGHSVMSDVEIEGEKGLHFIYTNEAGDKETDIVISPVLRKCQKTILKGEPFKEGEKVKILCAECRTELPVMHHCECGAPIYMFYLDDRRNPHYAHTFCSRIGCVKASRLRMADDEISDLRQTHILDM